jgi:hypothetical protein
MPDETTKPAVRIQFTVTVTVRQSADSPDDLRAAVNAVADALKLKVGHLHPEVVVSDSHEVQGKQP